MSEYVERIHFLATPFYLLSEEKVLSMLSQPDLADLPFRYLVTPNSDHVVRNYTQPELLDIYENACLSLCDSQVVARLARAKNYPIKEVVTGSELTRNLFESVFDAGHRITVIGCELRVVDYLKEHYGLSKINHHNPKMGFIHDDSAIQECCQFVIDHPADFVLIAVGSPQQEILASFLSSTSGCKGIGLCIGASLLFLSGQERRAPRIFSRLGLEWLFRLLQDPKRLWRRYFNNLNIFPMVFREKPFDGKASHRSLI